MKTFAALLFVSAFAVYVSASEMAFHRAVLDFLDERHDERMLQVLRDQGLSEDSLIASDHPQPPKWMVRQHILSMFTRTSTSALCYSCYNHAGLDLRIFPCTLLRTISYMLIKFRHIFFKRDLY